MSRNNFSRVVRLLAGPYTFRSRLKIYSLESEDICIKCVQSSETALRFLAEFGGLTAIRYTIFGKDRLQMVPGGLITEGKVGLHNGRQHYEPPVQIVAGFLDENTNLYRA